MNQQQFQQFVEMGAIDRVVIFEVDDGDGPLEVWAYGESLPMAMSNRIQKTRRPGARTWSTFDTCVAWVRACGWTGPVTLDTATPGVRS